MSKLWIFGDSFSCEWTDVVSPGHREYAKLYNPQHFKSCIENKLDITQTVNKAVSGYCNYSILESIGSSISNIQQNDYVVIGWSEITRYRVTTLHDKMWTIVAPNFTKPHLVKTPYSHRYECAGRDSLLSVKELNSWVGILNKALPKKTLMWTPFQTQHNTWRLKMRTPPFRLRTIKEVYKINDLHIISESHIDIGNWMSDIFTNKSVNYPDPFNTGRHSI